MNWIKYKSTKLAEAEKQAKDKAELKPRHIRRLRKLWVDQYCSSKPNYLNALFETAYSENISASMYSDKNFLLDKIKKTDNFTGQVHSISGLIGKN